MSTTAGRAGRPRRDLGDLVVEVEGSAESAPHVVQLPRHMVVDASAADCYCLLNESERYPTWWREIRGVRQIDDTRAEVHIRARIQLHKEIADERAGVLRSRIIGDLDGWSSWSITSHGRGCALRFNEEVLTMKPLMNLLSPIARPVLRPNHALMMRHGEQGLR